MSKQKGKNAVTVVVLLLILALGFSSCGENAISQPEAAVSDGKASELEGIRDEIARRNPVISGAQRVSIPLGESGLKVTVLWSEDEATPPPEAVVFLHGWSPLLGVPEVYGGWIEHLINQGNAVIFPSYIGIDPSTETISEDIFRAVRRGLREFPDRPEAVAVAGYTTGGALAFDYAAGAAEAGLPRAGGIFAIYPARNPGGGPIAPIDPRRIAADTEIRVLAGEGNPVLGGEEQARHLLKTAKEVPQSNKKYVKLNPMAVPWRTGRQSQRGIWQPFDAMLGEIVLARDQS